MASCSRSHLPHFFFFATGTPTNICPQPFELPAMSFPPQSDESDSDWSGAAEHEEDEADPDQSQSDDDDASSSAHAFLDAEASEADSDLSQSDGDDNDDLPAFPKFMALPAELREMVWKAFCPELDGQPRVFAIDVAGITFLEQPQQTIPMRTMMAVHHESRQYALKVSPDKIDFRHEEACVPCNFEKDILLMKFHPNYGINERVRRLIDDCLSPFHNIALPMEVAQVLSLPRSFLDLFDHLKNIYIVEEDDMQCDRALAWCGSAKTHEYTFSIDEDWPFPLPPVVTTYVWPDVTKHRDFAHHEFPPIPFFDLDGDDLGDYDAGGEDDGDSDSEGGDSDAEGEQDDAPKPMSFHFMDNGWFYNILMYRRMMRQNFGAQIASPGDGDDENSLGVWPMTKFSLEAGQRRLADLKARQHEPWDDWSLPPGDSDREETPDEYESDGIDDDEIGDNLLSDEEDDLPSHLLMDNDSDTLDLDGVEAAQFSSEPGAESSRFGDECSSGGRTAQADSRAIDLVSDEEGPDEPSPPRASRRRRTIICDSEDEDNEEPARGVKRHRATIIYDSENEDNEKPARGAKRRRATIIYDSEIEDNEGEASLEPARGAKLRRATIIHDSEDEDNEGDAPLKKPARGVNRRARAVLADSEDEDHEDSESPTSSRTAKRRARRVIQSDSEEEEEDDTEKDKTPNGAPAATGHGPTEDEGEDEASSSDDDDDDEPRPPHRMSLAKRLRMESKSSRAARPADDSDDEGADRQSYGGASDDDEGLDEEGSYGDGMIMDMAEEGEGEEDEDDMDGW